jgi:hypothetical protein
MDVLGPRIFYDGPVLSSRRWLPRRFQFSKLNDRGPRSTCEWCSVKWRANPLNRIEQLSEDTIRQMQNRNSNKGGRD